VCVCACVYVRVCMCVFVCGLSDSAQVYDPGFDLVGRNSLQMWSLLGDMHLRWCWPTGAKTTPLE